jgi:hypothetical protein
LEKSVGANSLWQLAHLFSYNILPSATMGLMVDSLGDAIFGGTCTTSGVWAPTLVFGGLDPQEYKSTAIHAAAIAFTFMEIVFGLFVWPYAFGKNKKIPRTFGLSGLIFTVFTGYFTSMSSTSKMSVASGGITPPAPREP